MASIRRYEPTRFVKDADGRKIPHPDKPGKFLTEKTGKTVWRATYRASATQQHSKQFDRKVDAQKWLDEVTASIITGQYVAPRAGEITFRDYAEQWRESQPHRPSTADAVRIALQVRTYPLIGHMKLSSFTPDVIQATIKKLEKRGYAPSTIEVTYSYIATVFKAGVASRRIATTPCIGIKLPEKPLQRVVPLTTEQVLALVQEMPLRYRAMIVLVAGTGLRQGEAFGLTKNRIDLDQNRIIVDRQLTGVKDGKPIFGPPKTGASYREVPIPNVVLNILATHQEKYAHGPQGLLFTSGEGNPIHKSSFWDAWQRALIKTEIKDGTGQGLHMLRHHYASLLIHAGESVKVVQARLGHKSAQETLDTYAHLFPDSDARTREAVDSSLEVSVDFLWTAGSTNPPEAP